MVSHPRAAGGGISERFKSFSGWATARVLVWSVLAVTTLPHMVQAQTVVAVPSTTFSYTVDPASSTATVTSVGAAATQLPGIVVIQNIYNGGNGNEATLNATIAAGSPEASLSASQYIYYFEGQAVQDTTDGTSPGGYANGPIMNVLNQATLSLSNPLSPPAVNSPILVRSYGADGYAETSGKSQEGIYSAGFGGSITVTNSGSISIIGNTTTDGTGEPWDPFMSGIYAESVGGNGAGAKNNNNDFYGNGGNGGGITININQGSQITMTGSGSPGAPMNGVTAYSLGGASGCDCSGDVANQYGYSGNGGTIVINQSGTITSTATNSIGIAAFSIGGDGGLETGHGVGADPGTSGSGGPVTVTLNGGSSIDLTSGNGIGVLAASSVGLSVNSPAGAITGGTVTVNLDPGATITSTGNGTFNMGVVAVSTGSPNILQPFASSSAVTANGSGFSGSVAVTNGGAITTHGQVAVGIAALSLGGAGVITAANGGSSYLGNAGTSSLGNECSYYGKDCPATSVTVTNTGTITTDGASSFGIIAAYNGAGGLISTTSNATTSSGGSGSSNNSWTSGTFVGGQTSSNNGPGGTVVVSNSGTITTGDGQGGGNAAIGVIAQSIGGGGGSAGGTHAAALVGDSGGDGGDGGSVTVNNSGLVKTLDEGALGVLAQSIGGGGGNGADAAGVFVATGGEGGSGGNGGSVSVTNSGTMMTDGDFAAAIIAQSIGGGGGNGGYATSAGLFVSAAIGGTGGGGGNGTPYSADSTDNSVTIVNTGSIETLGQDSLGILAQSVGGGGGNGGAAISVAAGVALTVSLSIGGTGGSGGYGGNISLTNAGQIATYGPDAIGIVAQSIGGGGGNGGASTAQTVGISTSDIPTVTYTSSLGGDGGSGGNGGTVTLTNDGTIDTTGDGSHGILAQSIAGGGGNGGDSTATSHAIPVGTVTAQVTVALGATGGTGGSAGDVAVTDGSTNAVSQISTGGADAAGIAAQSIAGGGGNSTAGNATNDQANFGSATGGRTYSFSAGVGAKGGVGGTAGAVQVALQGSSSISTNGSGSPGIIAQSIGGGGGTSSGGSYGLSGSGYGINANINISAGGQGVSGGNGGGVTVTDNGTIETAGGDSIGILAQSIGGGGGLAGSTDAAASVSKSNQAENIANTPSGSTYDADVAVGAKGGSGGVAGEVGVTDTGLITTAGERAYGIEAQSIGGGGGNGGSATSTASGTTNSTHSANVAVGGTGGAGGTGSTVTVTSSGAIQTAGYNADGILAQSIGGGGGVGGDGSDSANTTLAVGVSDTGSGGASGNPNSVMVTTGKGGSIATVGDDAVGILAQSIGGGGGAGSAGCTNSGSASLSSLKATACFGNTSLSASTSGPAAFFPSSSFSLNVGGGSGASGDGFGDTVSVNAPIITTGARSFGVVAQSIGGGGGIAVGAAQNLGATGLASSPGANAGEGGQVSVTLRSGGSITTSGEGAWGILAQSIGGGGGFSGDPSLALSFPVSNTLPVIGNSDASASTVKIDVYGNITTTGANAHGIFAQSIGGSGGIAGGGDDSVNATIVAGNAAQIRGQSNATYSGDGGAITIKQYSGSIIKTSGIGSIGIIAQSSGTTAGVNAISVTIGGAVIGGTNVGYTGSGVGAAGILLSGGGSSGTNPNTITVKSDGSVSTMDGVNGTAITTGYGFTNVGNTGTITGNINLGSNPGTITNYQDGTLNLGSNVTATSLINDGAVVVQSGTTYVSGNFTQGSTGTYGYAYSPGTNHTLAVSGSADLGGEVVPSVTTSTTFLPYTDTILTAGTTPALSATTPQTLLFGWNLQQSGNAITITPTQNLQHPTGVAGALTDDQFAITGYLARAWNNADPSLAATFASLYQIPVGGGQAYLSSLDAYSARATQGEPTALKNSEGSILGASMSCPMFTGATTLLGEGSCIWAKFGGEAVNQYASNGEEGYSTTGATYRIGAQKEFVPNWFFGGSLGAGTTWSNEGSGSTSQGQTFDGSVALKHQIGQWLLAGSFAVANGSYQNSRLVDASGVNAAEQSDSRALMIGSRLRAAYDIPMRGWYIRPYADVDVFNLNTPSFQESGASAYALRVDSADTTNVVISPMVEFGGRFNTSRDSFIMRYYADLGVSFLPGNSRTVDASLVGALPEDGVFATTINSPNVLGDLKLGLQLYQVAGFEVKADYDIHAGSAFFSQGGTLRLAYHF